MKILSVVLFLWGLLRVPGNTVIIASAPTDQQFGRGTISAIAVSGDLLAVSTSIGVWLYRLPNLDEVGLLESVAEDVAFSPDGQMLAVARQKTIGLWDVAAQSLVSTLEGHEGPVMDLAYSPDGTLLVSGDRHGSVRVWELASLTERFQFTLADNSGHRLEVAFTPDGQKIVAAGTSIQVRDAITFELLASRQRSQTDIRSLALSNQQVVTISDDDWLSIWKIDALHENPIAIRVAAGHVVAFRDAQTLLVGTYGEGLQQLELTTQQLTPLLPDEFIKRMLLLPDGQLITAGGPRVWDEINQRMITTGDRVAVWEGNTLMSSVAGFKIPVNSVAFGPDAHTVFTSVPYGPILIWDVETQTEIGMLLGHSQPVWSMKLLPEYGWLISAGADGDLRVWDVAAQTQVALLESQIPVDLPPGAGWIYDVDYHDNLLATAGPGSSVQLWDLTTLHNVAVLQYPRSVMTVRSVAFSPDGNLLATGCEDHSIHIWDVASRTEVAVLGGQEHRQVRLIAFSPDGTLLASSAGENSIHLWETVSWTEVAQLEHETMVSSFIFSPINRQLMVGTNGGDIYIWDVKSQNVIDVLGAHNGPVNALALAPDNSLLLSGGDGVARIWERR